MSPRPAWVPSPNFDKRPGPPDIIVLHYTDMTSADAALRWLTNPVSKVSAHYLISAGGDVTQMVAEEDRAWHAGASFWDGTENINGRSIGIELDNPGHRPGPPTFPDEQITVLIALLDGLRSRWSVPARNVVAHSDVAPMRKIDPGERFPWARLSAAGHAITVAHDTPAVPPDRVRFDAALRASGYGPAPSQDTWDGRLRAFHRRFRPDAVDAPLDGTSMGLALALEAAVSADRRATEQA